MKFVTTKFKSGGLHEKHVVATWNLGICRYERHEGVAGSRGTLPSFLAFALNGLSGKLHTPVYLPMRKGLSLSVE